MYEYHLCNVHRLGSEYCFAAVSVYHSVYVRLYKTICTVLRFVSNYYYKMCLVSLVIQAKLVAEFLMATHNA
jgi:hypothetical protein